MTALPYLAAEHPRSVVAYVLAEELRLGRVLYEDGRYRLVEEQFPADVLAALRLLAPLDLDHSRPVSRSRLPAPPSGALARSFA
jgi:hypothetical protein